MTNVQSWLVKHQSDHTEILDLWLLLGHVLGRNRAWLYAHQDHVLNKQQLKTLAQLQQQLQDGMPLAYLIGHKAFWNLQLKVTPDTLIPRPETELLVELALRLQPQPQTILDLGTGSGALALALASEWPTATIHAGDCSEAALAVAQENAQSHQLNQVIWHQSDWYQALTGMYFDLIISNPPYIDPNDHHLQQLQHEPHAALVAANAGLADIQVIVAEAHQHLKPGGHLMLEHGWDQKTKVQAIFKTHDFTEIQTHTDLAGHDRVTSARWL